MTLIVISRLRNLARRLRGPGRQYGAARRLLRDKIGEHEIHFAGTGLDLGGTTSGTRPDRDCGAETQGIRSLRPWLRGSAAPFRLPGL